MLQRRASRGEGGGYVSRGLSASRDSAGRETFYSGGTGATNMTQSVDPPSERVGRPHADAGSSSGYTGGSVLDVMKSVGGAPPS